MDPRPGYVLAVDLGTSGPKVALVSLSGRVVATEFEPNAVTYLSGGGAEQDPREWWASVSRAATRLLARGVVQPDEIVAVCCTGQWSGTVAVAADGSPLGNAIIWMDSRGGPDIARVTGGAVRVQGYGPRALWSWIRKTGGVPGRAGKDPLAHILYLQRTDPKRYAATATFLEPKDYLNFRLTGRRAASYDSISLHWLTDNRDIHDIRYDRQLIQMTGLDRAKLPDLYPSTHILGPVLPAVAAEWGLPPDIPVLTGSPDIHTAAIGSGAVRNYEAHLYIGTSSWLLCHVPAMKTDVLHNMASLPAGLPGRYLLLNEQEAAGACLTFLRDRLLLADDGLTAPPPDDMDVYAKLEELAERSPPGSNRLLFLPWLYGERTPVENHSVRGGFVNLSLAHTRADLIRAVMEGVAYNSRWLLQAVERFTKRGLTDINFIGGGARSDLWCQIVADVLDRRIRRVKHPIAANARGAAFQAAVALGYATVDQIAASVEYDGYFEPRPETRETYDAMFAEFPRLYRALEPTMARLNRDDHGG